MSEEPVLIAAELRKGYGDVEALRGLNLEVRAGEILGLLGPNGAGKTTTIKILATLERMDTGSATLFGRDVVTEPDEVRRLIGYVPQELSADKYLTGRESIDFFCRLYHLNKEERLARIDELLELAGLTEAADRQGRTYSGGMKKKLDLVCGLVHRPKLLFLDEPSLGLDVTARRTLWDYVRELRKAGMTILLSTNYMDEADALCDRIAVIDRGQVAAIGPPAELRASLGGDVISLEVPPSRRDETETLLKHLDMVREIWREADSIHVGVSSNETALPSLLEELSRSDIRVTSVSYRRPSLEEVFIKHTGRTFASAAGIAGPPPRKRGG